MLKASSDAGSRPPLGSNSNIVPEEDLPLSRGRDTLLLQ